jgi:hypothetical protein
LTRKNDEPVETRKFPRFKGRFFTFRAVVLVDQENRVQSSLLVFSSGKREVVKRYLWLKHVWDQLTRIEYELFILLLTDKDHKEWSFLKLQTEFSKAELRFSLINSEILNGDDRLSLRESYLGIKNIHIEIQREIRILPKTKKFSGYIKSLASRGKSKGAEKGIEPLSADPSTYIVDEDQFLLWESRLKPSLV